MIFSDEPRFHKSAIAHPTNSQIHGYTKVETEKHVGPGVYFANVEEEKRNGWASRSFSRREPMTPSKSNSPHRNEHYTAGVVTSYGALASPMSPQQRNNPGPGHYDGNILTSFPNSPKMNRPSSADSLNGTLSRNGSRLSRMDTSPRFALNTSLCMKDGILFQSRENNEKLLGPGHYPAAQKNEMLKKSHNVRVSSQKAMSPSQPRVQPITDIRQTFGTPGSTFRTPQNSNNRPRSASSSPLNRNQFSYGRNGGFFSPN